MNEVIRPEYEFRDRILQLMIDNKWSDLYLTVWAYPALKLAWEIIKIEDGPNVNILSWKDTMEFTQSLITEKQHDTLVKNRNLDFSFRYMDRMFRCNLSFQLSNYMIVIRLLNDHIPTVEDLNLSEAYKSISNKSQWLVLVTWPTWSWKTTTLAAIINYINENYARHIITIEDPVEYVHTHKKSIIEHKEVWKDVYSYETALMWAMRQDPDVIMFWEMRSKEQMEMALRLAETWHLVLSTLHTRSAHQTITRIIDAFPGEEKAQIRVQLADSLLAVFSQRLLKWRTWSSVKMAKEILLKNTAVSNLIRENELHQIPSVIQTWGREGMQLLETDLIWLVWAWQISLEEALRYANNPKLVEQAIILQTS